MDVNWSLRNAPPAGSRIAIVGGGGGIGRALASACRQLEHRVAVIDLESSIAARPMECDLVLPANADDPEQVRVAFSRISDEFVALDALVFLIGFAITPPRPTIEIDEADWDEVIRVNLTSAHYVTRTALPLLKRGQAPNIVTVSSGLGVSVSRGYGPYAAAKAGLIALTRTLAMENAPSVRVNSVAPGAINNEFMKGGGSRGRNDGTWFDPSLYLGNIPMGRLAEEADVVSAILFLASPGASFLTGQTLHVNGGRYMI